MPPEYIEVKLPNGNVVKVNKLNLENYLAEVQSSLIPTLLDEVVVTAPKKKNKLLLAIDKTKAERKYATSNFLDYLDLKKLENQANLGAIELLLKNDILDKLEQLENNKEKEISSPNFIHKVNTAAADALVRNTAFTDDKTLNFWMNAITPSLLYGAIVDGFQEGNYGSFVNSLKEGNSGFVSDLFYRDHPYLSNGFNFVGNAIIFTPKFFGNGIKSIADYGYTKLAPKNFLIAKIMNSSLKNIKEVPLLQPFMTNFKFGKDLGIVIRADRGNGTGAFTKSGSYIENGFLYPGKAIREGQRNFTWWNENEIFAPTFGKKPFQRVFIANKSDIPNLQRVIEMNERIGQWDPRIRTRIKKSEMVTPEPIDITNLTQYNYDPYLNIYVRSDIPTHNRFRVGDVEINDHNLAYRQQNDIISDFFNKGYVRSLSDERPQILGRFNLLKSFSYPMFSQGRLWYDHTDVMSGGIPSMKELLVTKLPLLFANKNARPIKVDNEGRRIPLFKTLLTPLNTSAYQWENGYGFRKIKNTNDPIIILNNEN